MPVDPTAIALAVSQYASALGTAVDAAGGLVEFFQSLRDPKARARRKRRQAARLWRIAARAAGRGYDRRATNLRRRAADAWAEAQRLDPMPVATAILADRGAV